MPFVPQECRDALHVPCSVGDLCYKEYLKLMASWKDSRRWTTCHNEFKRLFDCDDAQAAKALAFFVFFNKHVMPYEDEKEKENGGI